MAYIGSSPTKVVSRQSANIFTYTATANQTAFTGADANGNTLACTPSDIMVHMNGLKLEESDYTASTTTVTLGSGAAAGDEVTITAFVTFESADHYNKSTADTRYVNTTGDTMSGDLTIDTNTFHVDVADNRVGVGTTTPYKPLTISSAIGGSKSDLLDLQSSNAGGGTQPMVRFGTEAANSNTLGRIGFIDIPNYGGGFVVETNSSGGATHTTTEKFRVDKDGIVTMPNQPAFNARGASSASYGSGWQKLTYNDNVTQRGGTNYSHTNSRFTAPVTGYYQFNAQWNANNNADNDGTFTFWVNGAVPAKTGTSSMPNTGGGYDGHVISVAMPLTANDYVEVYRYSSVSNSSRSSSWQGNFSGYLIG